VGPAAAPPSSAGLALTAAAAPGLRAVAGLALMVLAVAVFAAGPAPPGRFILIVLGVASAVSASAPSPNAASRGMREVLPLPAIAAVFGFGIGGIWAVSPGDEIRTEDGGSAESTFPTGFGLAASKGILVVSFFDETVTAGFGRAVAGAPGFVRGNVIFEVSALADDACPASDGDSAATIFGLTGFGPDGLFDELGRVTLGPAELGLTTGFVPASGLGMTIGAVVDFGRALVGSTGTGAGGFDDGALLVGAPDKAGLVEVSCGFFGSEPSEDVDS